LIAATENFGQEFIETHTLINRSAKIDL
jgi:hypothetical protein